MRVQSLHPDQMDAFGIPHPGCVLSIQIAPIREIFARRIRNPGKIYMWNTESRALESGTQL